MINFHLSCGMYMLRMMEILTMKNLNLKQMLLKHQKMKSKVNQIMKRNDCYSEIHVFCLFPGYSTIHLFQKFREIISSLFEKGCFLI